MTWFTAISPVANRSHLLMSTRLLRSAGVANPAFRWQAGRENEHAQAQRDEAEADQFE